MKNEAGRHCSGAVIREVALKLLFLLVLVVGGCQSFNPLAEFGLGDATPEEERIRTLMKWHSGRVEVYRDFRTIFTARAVYLSQELVRSSVDWEARTRLLNPEERAALEKRFLGNGEGTISILMGFYTPEEELNDLSEENSVWIPHLKHADGTVTRAACFSAGEEAAKIYMRFLKWDLSWSRLYLLCFPAQPEEDFLTLVISGPQGQGEIRLQTTPPEKGP